jgi:hypothetical protein
MFWSYFHLNWFLQLLMGEEHLVLFSSCGVQSESFCKCYLDAISTHVEYDVDIIWFFPLCQVPDGSINPFFCVTLEIRSSTGLNGNKHSPSHLCQDLHKIWCTLTVWYIAKSHQIQIWEHKNQHIHPAAWNFVRWLQKYASTIVYCCIAFLQLLYRWQHQSRKL